MSTKYKVGDKVLVPIEILNGNKYIIDDYISISTKIVEILEFKIVATKASKNPAFEDDFLTLYDYLIHVPCGGYGSWSLFDEEEAKKFKLPSKLWNSFFYGITERVIQPSNSVKSICTICSEIK